MDQSICVATLQMTSIDDVEHNLKQADLLLRAAHEAGAQLAVLPEYFAWMSVKDTDKLGLAETPDQGPIQNFLKEAAKRYNLWIVGGTLPIQSSEPGRVYNRCVVVSPEGSIAAYYDKIHLFSFKKNDEYYCESNTIVPGSIPQAVDMPLGRLGLGICYDLRFPELFRSLLPLDILCLPAAFTHTTGNAHWNTLLRARAIENQCYVVASAQTGIHPGGRRTFGHSQIIDPWGTVLACEPEKCGMITAMLHPDRLREVRGALPALEHRRFLSSSTFSAPSESQHG